MAYGAPTYLIILTLHHHPIHFLSFSFSKRLWCFLDQTLDKCLSLCLYSPLLPLHMVNFWTLLGSQLTCLFPSLITINQGLPFYAFSGTGPFFLDSTYHNFYYKSTSQLIIKTFPHTTMRFRNFELIVYYNIPSAATYLIISTPKEHFK